VDGEYFKIVLGVIGQHGPWALLCFYLVHKHFKLQAETIEVMTAIRTLIQNMDCLKGKDQ